MFEYYDFKSNEWKLELIEEDLEEVLKELLNQLKEVKSDGRDDR